ncbi:MAG: hypothetical protein KGI97_00480 [Alphaproteobacteria bacterium]|nr:hypothetical protein [Alphaproteobacteria bacterium]
MAWIYPRRQGLVKSFAHDGQGAFEVAAGQVGGKIGQNIAQFGGKGLAESPDEGGEGALPLADFHSVRAVHL